MSDPGIAFALEIQTGNRNSISNREVLIQEFGYRSVKRTEGNKKRESTGGMKKMRDDGRKSSGQCCSLGLLYIILRMYG